MPVLRGSLFRLATSTALERAVRTVPPAERRARRAAGRYVAGPSAEDARRVAGELAVRGVGASLDHFGEMVTDAATADRVATDYLRLAAELDAQSEGVWLSVDMSHLGLDIDRQRCTAHLAAIVDALPRGRRVQVGAEDYDRAESVLGCVLAVASDRTSSGSAGGADRGGVADAGSAGGRAGGLGATVQANLRRSAGDIDQLVAAGVHVRLVKGAFVEPPDRALPYGEPTDLAYLRLAHHLAESGAEFSLATHDGVLREAILAAIGPRPVEQLLGVRPDVLDDLVARGVPVRVYVPFGDNWFRYWMRRVAESRGAF